MLIDNKPRSGRQENFSFLQMKETTNDYHQTEDYTYPPNFCENMVDAFLYT